MMVAIWFGVSFSAFLSLPPIILEIILGKENVASSYGLLVFIRGISITVGPPLAGLIYDSTSDYDGSFFFAGGLFSFHISEQKEHHNLLLLYVLTNMKECQSFTANKEEA